jgi:hypothetical protein
MDSETTVRAWQAAIIRAAEAKLGRELSDRELQFITTRGGGLALEAISDTVNTESREFVERYLNSE